MTARVCNYCSNPDCPYEGAAKNKQAWLQKQKVDGMPCWQPFPENIGVVHDETGRLIGAEDARASRTVFQNNNGSDYYIIAGDDDRALLRGMDRGNYVIARNLDWVHMCWGGGSYFAANEFERAPKAFLAGDRD